MILAILGIDLEKIFSPSIPVLEVVVRGTVTYLALFILLRVILKREKSSMSASDLLVVVLLADASQNSMAGSYTSVTEGVILVTTILSWSYFLNWLAYQSHWFYRLTNPEPLTLVENGKILWPNMRQELVTKDELIEQVREQGLEDLSQVQKIIMESNGRISIIQVEEKQQPRRNDDDQGGAA